ncbi:hypothetical protein [Modicisalibacter luteus]|uniref:Uncharacterized protein n=1 Tax=Modicisalibacter luteus TaxID=453962 RepID=A0ABV7M3I9_9GAMM|nr:hypothetical protein [Halomonas lutea]
MENREAEARRVGSDYMALTVMLYALARHEPVGREVQDRYPHILKDYLSITKRLEDMGRPSEAERSRHEFQMLLALFEDMAWVPVDEHPQAI